MAKNIKVNALASILVRVFNILFPLITGPYLARILSKEAYGEFNIANSILNLFIPFAAFGIYSYGIRSISRVKNNMKEISKNFTVLFSINVISSLSIGILYIGYMLLNVNSNMYMLYLALSIQIFTQFVTIEWMNEAFENYGFILFKTLFIRVLMLVSIFVFVKKADDIVNYAFILSITNLINYLISFYFIKRKVNFVKIELKDILIHIKPLLGMLLLANSY
ncbi:MAG: oligosaccharide flippase family protein, partial [Parvimonas sp.]|nr:oligosaccharide flippase family protein [Parvimonas sp.]